MGVSKNSQRSNVRHSVLQLAKRAFPFKVPPHASAKGLDTSFSQPGISQISVITPDVLQPSQNHCLTIPDNLPCFSTLQAPKRATFTGYFESDFILPTIISLFEPLKGTGRAGKDYSHPVIATEDEFQVPLSLYEETCIHGLPKGTCDDCSREYQRKSRVGTKKSVDAPYINVFDLLLPILQPPLGEEFDNTIRFPPNKDLKPFQRQGVRFLVEHEVALLADEMGVGKSIQAIVAARVLFRLGQVKDSIILCPKSVLLDWERKLWEWAPELRVITLSGRKQIRLIDWSTPAHVYIVTYETLRQDIQEIGRNHFDLVVLDEIQRIKNPTTKISKAVRSISGNYLWGLSGTPLENRVEDTVAIFAYLKPGLLKYEDAKKPEKVRNSIKPYFLRRKIEQVKHEFDLGEKISEEVWLDLSPRQRAVYDKAFHERVVELRENRESISITHVFAWINQLKQICNRDPVSGESVKFEYLIDALEHDIDPDEKVLVFSQYPKKSLTHLEAELMKYDPYVFAGGLSAKKRDEVIEKFQVDDRQIMLMSVKAGGLGLTITRANHIFHLDLWWNPAVGEQAEGRAYRFGQERTVFVTTLYTIDTIEEKIYRILAEKKRLFDTVIDDLSDSSLSKLLTEEELFSIFGIETEKPEKAEKVKPQTITFQKLVKISPYDFEDLVSDLCRVIGYNVKETTRSKDGGVDIYAKRMSDTGEDSIIVQCKHRPTSAIGVSTVRELYGVLASRQDIVRAVLITSGRFSRDAKKFSEGKNLRLIAGSELLGLLIKYDVSP
jgi:superfamily II DNA or RNA helicase